MREVSRADVSRAGALSTKAGSERRVTARNFIMRFCNCSMMEKISANPIVISATAGKKRVKKKKKKKKVNKKIEQEQNETMRFSSHSDTIQSWEAILFYTM